MNRRLSLVLASMAAAFVLLLAVSGGSAPAFAASQISGAIYVSPSGNDTTGSGTLSSPFATIGQAVSSAAPGAVIVVEPGTYKESVTITSALTLESDPASGTAANTIIDATGESNGIVVSGPQAAGTVIKGLTVENAQKAGIVVEATSDVVITGDVVEANDQSCSGYTACNNPNSNNGIPAGQSGSNVATGGTAFTATNAVPCGGAETGGSDCEALHLVGVTNATVTDNTVENNLDGGIYLTDESGVTSGNLIADNTVKDNQVDCGITLASHVPGHGVTDNLVIGNTSDNPQGAAGILLATPVPNGIVSGNLVENNTVEGNGSGGVVMHTHAPGSRVEGNVIEGNTITSNLADASSGNSHTQGITILSATGSPISDTVIEDNTISDEYYGLLAAGASGTVVPTSGSGSNEITVPTGGTAIDTSMVAPPPQDLGDLAMLKADWPVSQAEARALLPQLSADWYLQGALQKPAAAVADAVRAAYPNAGPSSGFTKAYLTAHGYLNASH